MGVASLNAHRKGAWYHIGFLVCGSSVYFDPGVYFGPWVWYGPNLGYLLKMYAVVTGYFPYNLQNKQRNQLFVYKISVDNQSASNSNF